MSTRDYLKRVGFKARTAWLGESSGAVRPVGYRFRSPQKSYSNSATSRRQEPPIAQWEIEEEQARQDAIRAMRETYGKGKQGKLVINYLMLLSAIHETRLGPIIF
jgi:hypothetical protein